jgi:hypothetical protein
MSERKGSLERLHRFLHVEPGLSKLHNDKTIKAIDSLLDKEIYS